MSTLSFALWFAWGFIGIIWWLCVYTPSIAMRRFFLYMLLAGPLVWIITLVGGAIGGLVMWLCGFKTPAFWQRFNTWLDAA